MLSVAQLSVAYGAIKAVNGISVEIPAGAIVTLIGGNGAGKTTTLQTISGLVRPSAGTICFNGEDITRLAPHEIVARGLCHVPEGRLVFANLSVAENLTLGAYLFNDADGIARTREHVFSIFPRLKERIKQTAGTLSGGEQQMLAIGRALMSRPKVLLLDEPTVGLAPKVNETLFTALGRLKELGVAIVVAEQAVGLACGLADDAVVLHLGRIAMRGRAGDVRNDPELKRLYLGG
jgi:branched-chain amino acid transport system ATP-binding protein